MFTQPIAYHAANSPNAVAIVSDGRSIGYADFDMVINRIANSLRPRLPAGKIVGVHRSQPYVDWLITLALARLDRATVSIPAGRVPASHAFVDTIVSLDAGLTHDRATIVRLDLEQAQQFLRTGDGTPVVGQANGGDMARFAVSSGTTGTPKVIALRHEQVVSRIKGGIFGSSMRADTRVHCTLPIGTFGGFGVPLRTWYQGGAVFLGNLDFRDVAAGRIRTIVTTPGGIDQLTEKLPEDAKPIDGLTVVSGGGHISARLIERTGRKLSNNLIMTYGSTETTTVATCRASAAASMPELTGIVLPWVDVEIVDETDQPVERGQTGTVRIRSVDMVDGYFGDPAASAAAFRDGWFYPGDLGRMGAQRDLFIVGRRDYVMNLNGYKIAPETVEQFIAELPGIRDVAVTAISDAIGKVHPVALIVTGEGYQASTVDTAIAAGLRDVRDLVQQIVPVIPRNDMMKIERHMLNALVQGA